MEVLNNLDLKKNQLQEVSLQRLSSPPSNPVEGQAYYNIVDKKAYIYTGTQWIAMAGDSNLTTTQLSLGKYTISFNNLNNRLEIIYTEG